MKTLVTGGAGYIGSHTCVELLEAGHEVVVIDNLVNSSEESIKRVQEITGKSLEFHKIDFLDQPVLNNIIKNSDIEAVIHFAGLKAVGESIKKPLNYYQNNIISSLCADPTLALKELKWQAELGLDKMCIDTWSWQQQSYLVNIVI